MRYIRYGFRCLVRVYFSVLYEVFRMMTKVDEDKVLFVSDVRGSLEGNLACVRDYLDDERYKKTTYLKSDRQDRVSISTFNKMIYDLATAKYILLEDYFRYISYIRPKEGQEICQLWHACGAYKKFGYSRAKGTEGIKIHKGYKKYTKAITSAESIRDKYAEAFGISLDKVKATGIPRTDIFFDEGMSEKLRECFCQRYPIAKDKKIILFAPTYRGTSADDATYDFSKLDLEKIYRALKGDYVFLIKWHPALYNKLKKNDTFAGHIAPYPDFYIDMSSEREINELLMAADILITDYSSVIFEYALLDRPIIYFTYDLEEYENGRGLYYAFEEYIYGDVVYDDDGLITAIREENMAEEKRKRFIERFMSACDGRATERTCKWIFDDIEM